MRNNVNIQVYSSCNCDCSFCPAKDRKHIKINPHFVLDYLEENRHIKNVVLTGGEPTLAIEECVEIIKGLKGTDRVITLQTNGWWGDNEKVKTALKESPPAIIHLSVDSEKQRTIPIETVLKAHRFLVENGIKTYVVNHSENEAEHLSYEKTFSELKRGYVRYDDGKSLYSCGQALLADNTIGSVDIKGWRGKNG